MAPVIVNDKFDGADDGLHQPNRVLTSGRYSLKIINLDRSDPPGYKAGTYPRSKDFNQNVFETSSTPEMPHITVTCEVGGFDPSTSPILWRLQTLYVVGRYEKINHNDSQPEYSSLLERHNDEWIGEAHSATFSLFAGDRNVTYDNFTNRITGGNCILTIAWKPEDSETWLSDYVHVRIVGTNPLEAGVRAHDQTAMAARDSNLLYAANAVFAWEAGFKQFDKLYRTQETFHGVLFKWPADPESFPVVAFDFGIGISQFTHWGQETNSICWDWRDNINYGINELLGDFANSYRKGITWIDWARRAWGRYNGGDPGGTGAYAARLAKSADGGLISPRVVPSGFDVRAQTAAIALFPSPPPPRPWPVPNTPASAPVLAPLLTSEHIAALQQVVRDGAFIADLIKLSSDAQTIKDIQEIAAGDMEAAGFHHTLHNSCAITLSEFLIKAGIKVPKIFGAGTLAKYMEEKRNWTRVSVGDQRAGDVGVTEDHVSSSGADHIYLVVACHDDDAMVIADNQKSEPHPRSARGRDHRTPTAYFLRALSADDLIATLANNNGTETQSFFPTDDEDTNHLGEPFLDGD